MDSIFGRIRLTHAVARRTFGVRVVPVLAAWLWTNLRVAVWFGQQLDKVFYPKMRTVEVRRPIVLVGNPRTGTTFMQRFLSDQGYGAGNEVYRMLYASLTLQALIKPFLPILEAVSPAKYHNTGAHETGLDSVETDDVAILFRYLDGFFLYGFFLAFDEEELREQFDPRFRDESARDFAWLEETWKRSIVAHGHETVVAKLFSLGPRLPQFLERFPQARVLYMARDPMATLPSGMSLVSGVLDNAFGFWKLPEEVRNRWIERLYVGLVDLQLRFTEQWNSGEIPHDRVFVVNYDRMMSDFDGMMDDLHAHFGIEPTEAQLAAIREQAEKQRAYKSGHKYNLAKYNLDPERIKRDCLPYYQAFLPHLLQHPAGDAASGQVEGQGA